MAFDEKVPLDFREIRDELDNALVSVSNKLEREWPKGLGNEDSQVIVVGLFRVALTTFMATRYVCASIPFDPSRKPEFVVAAPPMLRSVLDALATVVFLFEDLTERCEEFSRRGWKEDYDRALRYVAAYGDDPWWRPYLDQMNSEAARIRTLLNIRDEEVPKLRRWPILGGMISKDLKAPDRIRDGERLKFLTYMNDFFYRELSQEAHLSPTGLYHRAEVLLVDSRLWTDEHRDALSRLRSDVYMVAILLILSLASELQNELRFEMGERLVRLWTRMCLHSKMFEELYEFRYSRLLVGQP
jgi:hypothetical protein